MLQLTGYTILGKFPLEGFDKANLVPFVLLDAVRDSLETGEETQRNLAHLKQQSD